MSDTTLEIAANRDTAVPKIMKELTFDEKVSDLSGFIQFEPLIRELDYKVLIYCLERKGLSDIEERISTYPEFKTVTRDQYSLITELVNHFGLEFFELDGDGNPVLEADKTGLSEDEIDDLVVGYAYQTTEVGKGVIALLDPRNRLTELFRAVPERFDTYVEVLEFLREKHSLAEIDSLLRGRVILALGREAGDRPMQPTVFVEKLERAGGICFDGGWIITEEGKEVLATITNNERA